MRKAIRAVVPANRTGVESRELPSLVTDALSDADRERMGSITWHTVTVKLHMEVCGELERIAGARPQRIRRR